MAPGVDWSQFEVEAAPAPPGGSEVDWSQFEPEAAPSFDDVESGNETTAPVNFGNVIHGSNSQPLRQFSGIDRVRDAISAVPEALGAAFSGERYADTDTDPRRLVGVAEGAGRTFGEDLATMGVTALENVPGPLMAYTLYKRTRGEETPGEQYAGAVNRAVGVNDATMQFESPRAEMAARVLGHGAAALVPIGPVGEAANAEKIAARAGHLGPEAQGAQIADDIIGAAAPKKPRITGSGEQVDVPAETAPAIAGATPEAEATQVADILSGERLAPDATVSEATDVTPEELAAFERQRTPAPAAAPVAHVEEPTYAPADLIENNASGESTASLEAQHRVEEEQTLGRTRAVIDRDGTIRPLYGVDGADIRARDGQVVVQRGIGDDAGEWTILSHGDNLPPRLAQGVLNRSRGALDELHTGLESERAAARAAEPPPPMETSNASEVRSDTGQPGIAREAAAGSEADRSGDLQRAEEAGPSAGDGQSRIGTDGAVQNQGPLTGVKNRVVAEERHARGMDELDYEGRRTFPEDWEPAKEAFKADESIGRALAHSIVERPRALSGREVATLSMERARLAKMHREGMADIAHAMESGDIEAETIARGRLRETEGQLEVADRAAKASGYEGGFGLAARRMLSKEDYSLAELVTEAKVRKGGELTPKDRAHLESIAARIDGVEQELAAVRAQAMKKATRRAPKSVQDQYDALREQLKAIPKKEHTLCGVA